MYHVKKIFYTIQGEGANMGTSAVFVRFAGCNLWSGLEKDRSKAICNFCDTDFVGGEKLTGVEIVKRCQAHPATFVVLTGGEPALQVDDDLVDLFKWAGLRVAIETNGTLPLPEGIDWITVSPKAGSSLIVREGDELKLVYPQEGPDPFVYTMLTEFSHYYLSPMDGPRLVENTEKALKFCMRYPQWKLTHQMHKVIGVE